MLVVKARMPAEAGQMFIKAIEAACEEIPATEEMPAEISAETPNVKSRIDQSARKVDALQSIRCYAARVAGRAREPRSYNHSGRR